MLIIYCLFIGRGRLDWGARRSQAPGRKFYKRGTARSNLRDTNI